MSKRSTRLFIRELLLDSPHGVAYPDICRAYAEHSGLALKSATQSVRVALRAGQVQIAYIDRWKAHQAHIRWVWAPVYCAVEVPEDCPKPTTPPGRNYA